MSSAHAAVMRLWSVSHMMAHCLHAARHTHASRLCTCTHAPACTNPCYSLPPAAHAVRPAKKAPAKAARGRKALLVDSDEEEEKGELRSTKAP